MLLFPLHDEEKKKKQFGSYATSYILVYLRIASTAESTWEEEQQKLKKKRIIYIYNSDVSQKI